jgi:prepilin-type N-terminal cleavage/methylation domain-containing protein
MHRRTHGFTLIELVIALLIGTILTSVAMGTFKSAQGRLSVRSAKATYASLHARARATGIERGTTIAFVVDSDGDSAYIQTAAGVQEVIRFDEELNIDLRSSPSTFSLCMTPRGYADKDCGTTTSVIRLQFWQNADSTSLLILPLGQLVGM